MNEDSFVGDPLHFRGLVYEPVNEQGVILIFGMICEDLNIIIEEIKTTFPDCIARQRYGDIWKKIRIEFEFKSSNFKEHNHDPDLCDIIVCWEHDWKDYPKSKLDVISLQEEVEDLRKIDEETSKTEIEDEDDLSLREEERKIKEVFSRWNSPTNTKDIFYSIDPIIKEISPTTIWMKPVKWSFNYYSPTHVFVWIAPQKRALAVGYYVGDEWQKQKLVNVEEIEDVIPFLKKSYELINRKHSCMP